MNQLVKNIYGHWKSTVQGIVTTLLGLSGAILAVKANPAVDPSIAGLVSVIPAHWLAIIAAFSGAAKLVMGAIQQDPDKVLAKIPGQTEPQMVAAHPIPDDKNAVAVMGEASKQ